jgi:hypothetical protein
MPIRSNRRSNLLACSVCNQLVELETTMIDESGKPVHEECYVRRVRANMLPIRGDPNRKDKSNAQRVVEFLNSATHPVKEFCFVCGSPLEHHEVRFFYKDGTWEIPLRRCPTCDPPPSRNCNTADA